jgi:predicted MFS family arabinose efflux permease
MTLEKGVAGAILPFVFQALLARYGYKSTLRGTAIAIALLTGPLIPFCKNRLPIGEQSALASMDWQFGKRPLFWSFLLATIIQGLGLFFPVVFLPSYAADIGLKESTGALSLSLMAMSQFCGQSAFGFLSDRQLSPSALAFVCCIMTALSVFLLWGFARSLPLLIAFSLVHGFFGYGFSSMRSAMAKQLTSDPNTLMALQSILNGSLGIGNILVGPLSSTMIAGTVDVGEYGVQKYVGVVTFSGSCMLASALVLTTSFFIAKR